MGIERLNNPPSDGLSVVVHGIHDLSPHSADNELLGGQGDIEIWSGPLRVYRLGLTDFDNTEFLSGAQPVGWRYLVGRQERSPGFADIVETPEHGSTFASFVENRNAARLVEAVHLANQIGSETREAIELRALEIPALYVSALWLSSNNSVFIPYISPLLHKDADIRADEGFINNVRRLALDVRRQQSVIYPTRNPSPH